MSDDEIAELIARLSPAHDIAARYDKQHLYVAKPEDPILTTALRDSLRAITQLRDERDRLKRISLRMFEADDRAGVGFYNDRAWTSAYDELSAAVGGRRRFCP